jgi:hypothetical protein
MLEITIDAHGLEKLLGPMIKQTEFVAMKAINDTLFMARKDQMGKLKQNIEGGPTAWTRRGLRYYKASKNELIGTLYFASGREYMKTIMDTGTVRAKKKSLVAPVLGKIKLNKFGNIPATAGRGKTLQLLKARGKDKGNYFIGDQGKGQDAYGLYKRTGRGKNKKATRIIYLNLSSRKQKKTYDGRGYAERFIARKFKANIMRAARRAALTAR